MSADLFGWAAAGLMVGTFFCRDGRSMRPLAVATNLAFITYGALAHLPPVLALHLVLLPINLWRWAQLRAAESRPRPPQGRPATKASHGRCAMPDNARTAPATDR